MRISLLEKREDFYKILKETMDEFEMEGLIKCSLKKNFYCNKYLNFVATNSLDNQLFNVLVNEYSNSLIWWRKAIQKTYVHLATRKGVRFIFSQKKIKLKNIFQDYLILGGNHRLRMFSEKFEGTLVLLKKGESRKFIENDIQFRSNINIVYAPEIIKFGDNWYLESVFEGIPINRCDNVLKNEFKEKALSLHCNEVLFPNIEEIRVEDYRHSIVQEINENFETIKSELISNSLRKLILETVEKLFSKIDNEYKVKIAWTHGDLQEANILINNSNEFKIIDWEASNTRFVYYDLFVAYSNIRGKVSFFKSKTEFEKYSMKLSESYNLNLSEDVFLLLALEELRYNIDDKISNNFYFLDSKIKNLCKELLKYIN